MTTPYRHKTSGKVVFRYLGNDEGEPAKMTLWQCRPCIAVTSDPKGQGEFKTVPLDYLDEIKFVIYDPLSSIQADQR